MDIIKKLTKYKETNRRSLVSFFAFVIAA